MSQRKRQIIISEAMMWAICRLVLLDVLIDHVFDVLPSVAAQVPQVVRLIHLVLVLPTLRGCLRWLLQPIFTALTLLLHRCRFELVVLLAVDVARV